MPKLTIHLFKKKVQIFFKNFSRLQILLIIITTFFILWSRFYHLKQIPVALTHDETVYAIQAKSFAIQGTDVSQSLGPWSLEPIHHMYAEWPATLMTPFFKITDNPIFAAHLITAIMGTLLPFGFAWLVYGIWQKKDLTLVAFVVAAASPLLWQFSRLAYDSVYSSFFYVFAAAIYLNFKNYWKLLTIPVLTLGFFQYQGMKLLLVPWMLVFFLIGLFAQYKIKNLTYFFKAFLSEIKKPTAWVLIFTVFLTLIYGFVLLPKQDTGNRLQRTIFSDDQFFTEEVNTQRRVSLVFGASNVISNKATLAWRYAVSQLVAAFNPNLLFLQGEPAQSGFAVWSHGVFYLIDALLILIGIVVLLNQTKQLTQTALLLIFPVLLSIPTMINTMSQWYLLRQQLAYLTLLLFVSWGFYLIIKQKFWRWLLVAVYLVSIANFYLQFFYRYPVYSADMAEVQERVISRYISLIGENYPQKQVIVYCVEPDSYFASYVLYNNLFNKQNSDHIAEAFNNKNYSINNVTFTAGCIDFSADAILIGDILNTGCDLVDASPAVASKVTAVKNNYLTIPAVIDSGEMFRIYGDELCSSFKLKPYFRAMSLNDFAMESMPAEQFCYTWITDLSLVNS